MSDLKPCPKCHGTKVVVKIVATVFVCGVKSEIICPAECPTCHGTGRIPAPHIYAIGDQTDD